MRRLLLIVLLTFTGSAQAAPPKVIASIKPLHSLVATVMEGVAEPGLLVEGNLSIHSFTLKPSQRQKIEDAEVIFYIGGALESFLPHLLEAEHPNRIAIPMMDEGMQLLPNRKEAIHTSHEHNEHSHGAYDPHIWLSPENAKHILQVVSRELSVRYPEYAKQFQQNTHLAQTRIELQTLAIQKLLAPVKDKQFIVFHDAYQYFEKTYGLKSIASVTLQPEESISANRMSDLLKLLEDKKVDCLFGEPNMAPRLMQQLNVSGLLKAGTLDPEGITLKQGKDLYFVLIQNLANNVAACLIR